MWCVRDGTEMCKWRSVGIAEKPSIKSIEVVSTRNSSFTVNSLFKALAAVVHSVRRETAELAGHTKIRFLGCKSGLARKAETKKCVSGFRRNVGTVQQLRV